MLETAAWMAGIGAALYSSRGCGAGLRDSEDL